MSQRNTFTADAAKRSQLDGMLGDLLRFGLFGGNEPIIPTDMDWEALLLHSQSQAMTAILFDILTQLPSDLQPPREVLLHWASLTHTIEEQHKAFAEAAQSLQQRFSQHFPEAGARPLPVVKGLRIARAYPNPAHREFGDIDLYSADHTNQLQQMLEQIGLPVDNNDRRHLSFRYDGQLFEAHRYLLYDEQDKQRFVQQYAVEGLTPELHALFVAAHIERHAVFFHEAVKWKSLLDWAMLMQPTHSDGTPNPHCIDYVKFTALAEGYSIGRFADLLTHYVCHIFALPLPPTRYTPSPATLQAFDPMYCELPPRHPLAIVRVARRVALYLRHNRSYKEIYGQSMFRRFYFGNVAHALKQVVLFQHREGRRDG